MKSHKMSAKTQVFCDKCGGAIVIESAALKTKRFSDGVQFDYFRCEKCGEVYVYCVTDAELRKDILRRGFVHSSPIMKLRLKALKKANEYRVEELP